MGSLGIERRLGIEAVDNGELLQGQHVGYDLDGERAYQCALLRPAGQPVAHGHKHQAVGIGQHLLFLSEHAGRQIVSPRPAQEMALAAGLLIAFTFVSMVADGRHGPHVVHGPHHGFAATQDFLNVFQ